MTGSIGIPKKSEIIKALIEERGDCEKAAQRCCTNRINMVCYFTILDLHQYCDINGPKKF